MKWPSLSAKNRKILCYRKKNVWKDRLQVAILPTFYEQLFQKKLVWSFSATYSLCLNSFVERKSAKKAVRKMLLNMTTSFNFADSIIINWLVDCSKKLVRLISKINRNFLWYLSFKTDSDSSNEGRKQNWNWRC